MNGTYDKGKCLSIEDNSCIAARHLTIRNEQSMKNCSIYFPNVVQLTISIDSPINSIVRIVSFSQITTLNIDCKNYPFRQLLELFCYTSNCRILTINSILLPENTSELEKIISNIQGKINTSNIKNLIITDGCTLEIVALLIQHCHHLEHISIYSCQKLIQPLVQYLLSEAKQHSRYLCSLRFSPLNEKDFEMLRTFIKSNQLLKNYLIKLVLESCYICW